MSTITTPCLKSSSQYIPSSVTTAKMSVLFHLQKISSHPNLVCPPTCAKADRLDAPAHKSPGSQNQTNNLSMHQVELFLDFLFPKLNFGIIFCFRFVVPHSQSLSRAKVKQRLLGAYWHSRQVQTRRIFSSFCSSALVLH